MWLGGLIRSSAGTVWRGHASLRRQVSSLSKKYSPPRHVNNKNTNNLFTINEIKLRCNNHKNYGTDLGMIGSRGLHYSQAKKSHRGLSPSISYLPSAPSLASPLLRFQPHSHRTFAALSRDARKDMAANKAKLVAEAAAAAVAKSGGNTATGSKMAQQGVVRSRAIMTFLLSIGALGAGIGLYSYYRTSQDNPITRDEVVGLFGGQDSVVGGQLLELLEEMDHKVRPTVLL